MTQVKVAVIYYTSTGANHKMAQWAKMGAEEAGAEVRLLKVKETAPQSAIDANEAWKKTHQELQHETEATMDDLEWADVIIFSVPTRYGNAAGQFQAYIDQTGGLWASGKTVNKVVSAMSSAMNPHGGQESTIQSIYKTMCHWGAIIVPPGYSDESVFGAGGNPYGASATVSQSGEITTENLQAAVVHQAKRTVEVGNWVKAGMGG
ncbi:NAD(P)H:quinone oxidoreductase [Litoribacter ruber]|uniref:NAD(P)H:quinone oxidoreductase n=1 Tax=Litoribacter ruber TaxID=702568 RepID=UPI001BD928BD|nr:NAD(P)H:quinone oxidoreductase [Litoribacter ruber]MBT0810712.1 NAD(P)H:quinone oxidoreductase [Litoribacter ruber]